MAGLSEPCRAITLQQPFAALMAHGACNFTRRGKPASFASDGEWVAIHCGSNDEHLKNAQLMDTVRQLWGTKCLSDAELRAQQGGILGFARFVDGSIDAKSVKCPFMQLYSCTKQYMWKTDSG